MLYVYTHCSPLPEQQQVRFTHLTDLRDLSVNTEINNASSLALVTSHKSLID